MQLYTAAITAAKIHVVTMYIHAGSELSLFNIDVFLFIDILNACFSFLFFDNEKNFLLVLPLRAVYEIVCMLFIA